MGGYYREMTDRNYENCNSQNLRIGMENRGEIAQLYPTPIYWVHMVDNFDAIQTEIGEALKNVNFSMKEAWGNTHYLSDPSFTENLIVQSKLDKLKDEIVNHVNYYCKTIGFPQHDGVIATSWASLFKQGNYGHCHHHGNTDISGVYYFKTEDTDGKLYFENPVPCMTSSYTYKSLCERQEIVANDGLLCLFPGWLMHGISTNTKDSDRISISFNIDFVRHSHSN